MTSARPYLPNVPLTPWIPTAKAFPWLIFLACWLSFFLMDQKMDAPLTSLEDRVVSDVAQQVSDGDVMHKVLTAFLGVLGGYLWFRYRSKVRIHGVMAGIFVAYLTWICAGALTADDPGLTIRRTGGFMLSLLLCAGCAARMDVVSNSIFVAGIPTLTLFPDIIAELQSHGLAALAPAGRFGGTYPHPNVAAAALAVPLIVFTWLAIRTNANVRLGFASLACVVSVFFALTRSRTALLAVLAALTFSFVIILLRNQRKQLTRLLGVVVLGVGVVGLGLLAANSSPSGMNLLSLVHSDRDEGDPTTLTGRVDLWKTCLEYAVERPLLGYGFGGFWSAKHIESISEEQKWPINQSHSAYLDQALGLGFPGALLHVFVIFGAMFICTARFFRGESEFGAWAALLVFVAVHGLTEAISLAPGYLNFVLSLMVVQIALIKPANRATIVKVPTAASRPAAARPPYAIRPKYNSGLPAQRKRNV